MKAHIKTLNLVIMDELDDIEVSEHQGNSSEKIKYWPNRNLSTKPWAFDFPHV